jgi:uncharacterized membrane protein
MPFFQADDPSDHKNWKWGLFYANPDDNRLFVWKGLRALGFTLNYAHKEAHVITGLMVLMFAVLAKFA